MAQPVVNSTPRGALVGRFARALLVAKGDALAASAFAEGQGGPGWREVAMSLKDAVTAGDTDSAGWANELSYPIAYDFCEALRPATLIGRMSGFIRVPFNVRLIGTATGTTASWRGEANPLPVSKMDFDDGGALEWAGVGALSLFTQELARSSHPNIDATLSADIVRAVGLAIDQAFADPANSGVAGVKPASVTSGATAIPSTGSAIANVDADLRDAVEAIGDSDLSSAYWLMAPHTAVYLATLRGSGGAAAYAGVTAKGGSLLGIPVLTSGAIVQDADSPAETFIALVCASEILVADDGQAKIDYSTQSALQMVDAPNAGAAAQVPLWQNGLVAIKGERAINWARRRATAAAVIVGVSF